LEYGAQIDISRDTTCGCSDEQARPNDVCNGTLRDMYVCSIDIVVSPHSCPFSLSSLLPFFFLLSTLRIVTTPLTTKALVPHISSRSVAAKNDTVASQVGCWLGGTQGTNLDQVSTNVAAAQENPGNSLGRGVPDATPE
jgi:hypothetical protein